MEIDKAIGASEDKRLKTKYNNAIFVIKRALALYSSVSLHLSHVFDLQIHFLEICPIKLCFGVFVFDLLLDNLNSVDVILTLKIWKNISIS